MSTSGSATQTQQSNKMLQNTLSNESHAPASRQIHGPNEYPGLIMGYFRLRPERMSLLLSEVYQANTLVLLLQLNFAAQLDLLRCSSEATIEVSRVGNLVRNAAFR
jgi:hypothetical protein